MITLHKVKFFLIIVTFLLLAAVFRFYGLGTWPFAGDEPATLWEDAVMFHGAQVSHDSQTYRLPHLIPLSYFFLHLSNTFFGSNEFGSRVIMAIFGILSVASVFLLLDGPMGRPIAIAVCMFTMLWPEHIFRSQEFRFYMVVALFSFLSMLFGAYVLERKPIIFSIVSCCMILAAILSHTLAVVLLPTVFLGILIGSYADQKPVRSGVWVVFFVTTILIICYLVFYAQPLMYGWNRGGILGLFSNTFGACCDQYGWMAD